MAKIEHITVAELREAFAYDPETGIFTRKIRIAQRGKLTDPVGSISVLGYRRIKYRKVSLIASRVAWAIMTGEWPANLIDHINGDRADDRWRNLREATYTQNAQNRRAYDHTSSGLTGAYWREKERIWTSAIRVNRKLIFLGYHATKEAAHAAYLEAKQNLHPFQPVPRGEQ